MYDAALLMEVPDALRDLHDDVSRELFREVGKLDDLVEQLSSAHEPGRKESSVQSERWGIGR